MMINKFSTRYLHFPKLLIIRLVWSSCGFGKQEIESIDTSEVQYITTQNENAVVLDVRTPEEYVMGHIRKAININIYEENFSEKVAELDRKKTYIVYCAANVPNGRSDKSLLSMQELGFESLKSIFRDSGWVVHE